MKIAVTNLYSSKQKGDYAIILAMVLEFRRVFPAADIKLLSTDPKNDKDKYGAPVDSSLMWILFSSLRDDSLFKRSYEFVLRVTGLILYLSLYHIFKMRPRWLLRGEIKSLVHNVEQADVVIACGGGYLSTANSAPKTQLLLFGMCLSFLTGHYLGKPVYLYSQSVGPFRGGFSKSIVKFSLKRVQLIELREDISVQYVNNLRINTTVVATADAAFLLKGKATPSPVVLQPSSLQVGITVRTWFSDEAKLANYLEVIARTIDHLATKYDAQITYMPQVIASGFGDDDRVIAKQLQDRVKKKDRFTVLTDNLHPFELIDLCSKMDLFIGTRMHSNIFALVSNVPVVAIMYEHKTQGIMDRLGIGDATVDIEKINYKEIKQKVEKVIDNRKHYRDLIKLNLPKQIELSRSAMEIIKHDIEQRKAIVAKGGAYDK